MKVVAISDTHLRHSERFCNGIPPRIKFPKIPDGDILIHAGDMAVWGDPAETQIALNWFGSLPHKYKICIAGNHDQLFQNNPTLARSMVPSSVIYLEDKLVEIEGIKIYGSPWTPQFMDWAFMMPRGELWRVWSKIPDGIDILVTHGPPASDLGGLLPDYKEEVGDEELLERILQVRPRVHICGHVHVGRGLRERHGIRFINAAICNDGYWPVYEPIVFDIEKR